MYKYHPCWIWEVALGAYPWSSSSLFRTKLRVTRALCFQIYRELEDEGMFYLWRSGVKCHSPRILGVSKNRGVSPKMDGENNGNPIKMDDLGGKPIIFGNTLLDSQHFIFLPKIVPFLVFENSVFRLARDFAARSTKQRWSRWASDLSTKPKDFSKKNVQFRDPPSH